MSELERILHPKILEHSYQQFLDGHLRSAVLDAFIAVFDLIRERTGLGLDGAELVGRVFSLSDPMLIVSELDTESGKSDQKGFIQILQGAYLSVRNPKAHSLRNDLDDISAAQYLVFASLLARRVEAAILGNVLRFNGLYISTPESHSGLNCLRFYEDGEVLSVSTSAGKADLPQIMSWFTKENAVARDYARGTYVRNGNKVDFSTKSKYGEIEYQGEIKKEKIKIRWHALAINRRGESEYTFQEI